MQSPVGILPATAPTGLTVVDYPVVYNPVLDYFTTAYFTIGSGMFDTKFIPSGFTKSSDEYVPAPLTFESAFAGLAKFVHDQYTVTYCEYQMLYDWLSRIFLPYMIGPLWSDEKAMEMLDPLKASGVYWQQHVGPLKADVIKKFDFHQLLQHFRDFVPCFSAVLKDELRLVGKRSRLFMPGPVDLVAVGNKLFGAQNERLTAAVHKQPCTIGISNPGSDITRLFLSLYLFKDSSLVYDADGASWDANFQLWQAMLCRDLRLRALSAEDRKLYAADIYRYYEVAYNGWVNFYGSVLQVTGQRSGHTVTAHDNSIGNVAQMCLHAIRMGYSFDDLRSHVLFYCNGDDLIYATDDKNFSLDLVAQSYFAAGNYLEGDVTGRTIFDCHYIGVTPVVRHVGQCDYLVPLFNEAKLLSSAGYFWKGASSTDKLMKLTALCILCFGDLDLFRELCQHTLSWIQTQRIENFDSKVLQSCLMFLTDEMSVLRIFTSFERTCTYPFYFFWDTQVAGAICSIPEKIKNAAYAWCRE